MKTNATDLVFSDEIKRKIDTWSLRYPKSQKQSAVMYALKTVQQANRGYLTDELLTAVADHLSMPAIAVYEIASFYTMYNTKPVGRYKLDVCTNISCKLRGADEVFDGLKKRLQIEKGETTKDGLFTLHEVECLGACANAPVMQVNDRDYHEDLTVKKMDEIISQLARAEVDND